MVRRPWARVVRLATVRLHRPDFGDGRRVGRLADLGYSSVHAASASSLSPLPGVAPSASGSGPGRPNPASAMILRWISLVPA